MTSEKRTAATVTQLMKVGIALTENEWRTAKEIGAFMLGSVDGVNTGDGSEDLAKETLEEVARAVMRDIVVDGLRKKRAQQLKAIAA